MKGGRASVSETGKDPEVFAPSSFAFGDLQDAIHRLDERSFKRSEWKIVKVLLPEGDVDDVVDDVLRQWWDVSCRHASCEVHSRCHFRCVRNGYTNADLIKESTVYDGSLKACRKRLTYCG